MSQNSLTPKKSIITNEQQSQIDQLRQQLKDILTPDLDTDLNLYRWIHGWNGNISEASQRFRLYIENRRASHLDQSEFPDQFLTHPTLHKFGLYFSFSIMPDAVNPMDDTVVVIQKMENIDFHQMAKILTCGQFVQLYFVVCERVFRQILKRERETGRQSGLTIIYDLANFPIWNYVNPNAPIHKIHKLCLHLLQDYYCDMLHRVYIVNAPRMLSIVLEIVKKFLNPMTQEKLVVVSSKEELLKKVHPSVVPLRFGGQFQLGLDRLKYLKELNLNLDPETCSLIPKKVTDDDYFIPKQFPVQTMTEYLKPKQKFEMELKTGSENSKLWWQFKVDSDVQFAILHLGPSGHKTLVTPRMILNSPKLPEEGHIVCDYANATYILEFVNCSTTWFSLKLEYAAYVDNA